MSGHTSRAGDDGRAGDDRWAEPVSLSSSLGHVVRALTGAGTAQVRSVFDLWPEVVGEQIAGHARPVALDDGVLTVVVDDPAWVSQLRYLQSTLIERLAEAAGPGVVRNVELRVDRPGPPGRRTRR